MVNTVLRFNNHSLFLLACLLLLGAGMQTTQARLPAQTAGLQPRVSYPVQHDLSPKLGELASVQAFQPQDGEAHFSQALPKASSAPASQLPWAEAALQDSPFLGDMPATGFNFEGINNVNGVLPPDTNGDVGPNHYVQWVNLSMAIWSLDRSTHSATLVYGPSAGNAIWNGFGGICQTNNDGDPIVLYDHLADRWLISQFALNFPNGPFYQCMAVSQTPDPTGSWYRYAFLVSNNKMNDYPKLGVWPDGYYMSVNQFSNKGWGGAGVAVYEREKMLLGQAARQVYFDLYDINPNFGGMLPADLDGPPPPAGTPNYFAEIDDGTWIPPVDAMRLWEFQVDWLDTVNSSFGVSGNPNITLPVAAFTPLCTATRNCIQQPGTNQRLDALGDRLMHRLQYRNYGTFASLVTNHTVNAGSGRAGLRWYELRRTGSTWNIYQQGTYIGDGNNSEHRWMGSAAMDAMGNLAIGYSLSSNSVYPSIYYTGRLVSDPLNTLNQGEALLFAGTGAQTSSYARWGDYSMLSVDPSDECTFWFTSEYLQATSNANWRTRIGSFVFPNCSAPQKGTLQGTVTSGAEPLANASIQADGFSTTTDNNGFFQLLDLPTGTYTLTASAYGYQPAVVTGVVVANNATTIQDFNLSTLPLVNVSGKVSDGSGQGWSLYARLHITASGMSTTVFTNPASGSYSLDLASETEHSFEVSAVGPGYLTASRTITPSLPATIENFSLQVESTACIAPGYAGTGVCNPQPGGLLTGNVYDLNTGQPLNGASITSLDVPGNTTFSLGTPDDPAVEDGFYTLFSSLVGTHDYTATLTSYSNHTQTISISLGEVTTATFQLPAGSLSPDPGGLTETLGGGEVITRSLKLHNSGTWGASFTITEVEAAWQALTPDGPFAVPTRHTSPKHLSDLDAAAVYDYNPPPASLLPGGQVLSQWQSGLEHIWGVGYDTHTDSLWVGNLAAGGGDDRLYRFDTLGSPTVETIETGGTGALFAADLTYDPFRRTFWQVNIGANGGAIGSAVGDAIGGGNCLVEIDPLNLRLSGSRICPAFHLSQRGLAYNPLNNSYYSGAWTDGILYHFDARGTILGTADTGLNISGLAFNPDTQHLFVLTNFELTNFVLTNSVPTNADQGFDVYVLDVNNSYAILGGFDIPDLSDFQQAGMSLDCEGHLWLANQGTQKVLEVESGEPSACLYADVTWLSAAPDSGSVPTGGHQDIQVRIDPSGLASGSYQAQLVISNDTPYGTLSVPITLTVPPVFLYLPSVFR